MSDGRYGLMATPEDYDGVPSIDMLTFDRDPLVVHDDIVSVASILAFGEFCGGPIQLPRKTSPEVVRAIEHYLEPIWISASPVEFESRANPKGEGTLLLDSNLSVFGNFESEWGKPRNSTLCVVPSSEFSGSVSSSNGMILASNAPIMGALSPRESSIGAELAVGLLFAESFQAGTIRLGNTYNVADSIFLRLQKLLYSCKINLLNAS